MMRRTIGLLTAITLIGCGRNAAKVGADRVTLATGAGDNITTDVARDGRIAFARYVEGKQAIYVTDRDSAHAKRLSFGVYDFQPTWSPDGKMIAFNRDAGGNIDVAIVPADSGAELDVASTRAEEVWGGWLPDASGLVFMRSGEKGFSTWLYSVADRKSARLFDADGSVVRAVPSPDGKWIAYSLTKDGKSTLWLWDRVKHTHRQLTSEGFESIAPRCFSPDGRSMLYESRRTGTSDLWRIDVATGERKQLTEDVANDVGGRWSPDGSRILFSSTRGGQPDLWVLSTGEADVQRVTDDAINEASYAWMSDGRGIVAVAARGHRHLYALTIAGGAATQLTSGDWDVVDSAFAVSRDGSHVAFTSNRNGDYDVWTVPAAGGESRLVGGAPGYDGTPTWSPDGKRIAFVSTRSGNKDIWIAAADGSGSAARLTDWPTDESNPQWSPDGKMIAFRSNRDSPGRDIWTMPAAGGSPKRITRTGTVETYYRWSPDGQSISFATQSDAAGGLVIFVVSAAGGAPKQLTPPTAFSPTWSPDGRRIAASQCNAGYCVIEVRSLDGKLVKSFRSKPDVYENWASWSADGSQLLVGFQDLVGDGSFRVELRSMTDGTARLLENPREHSVFAPEFALGGKAAIGYGVVTGSAMQRIAVPAPLKAP